MKRSIIGGDLNLPQVDWKGIAEDTSVTQAFINRWCGTRGKLWWLENRHEVIRSWTFTSYDPKVPSSCGTVQGISDQCGALLDVEWADKFSVTQEKRLVPAYHKANVLGLQQFLRDKLPAWAEDMRRRHMQKIRGHGF